MESQNLICRRLLACVFFLLFLGSASLFAQNQNFQLILDNVRVDQQREGGGDRPYFATIVFRSRLFQRRSTVVSLIEGEPHDWVSKAEYNGGRLRQRDHMSTGETLNVPAWMGKLEWQNVEVRPFSPAAAVGAELFGAIVISLDNNNTPPHVVRGLMNKVKDLTANFLRSEVETGRIATTTDWAAMQTRIGAMARNMVSTGDVIDLLFQMTIGSTFNPDRLTGIQVFIFPALTGITTQNFSFTVNDRNIGPVTANVDILPPNAFRNGLRTYTGSGGRYAVNTRLVAQAAAPPVVMVNELELEFRTGGDDLRGGNDNLNVSVLFERATPHTVNNVNGGGKWRDNSINSVRIRLPRPTPLSEISGLELRTTFGGGMGGDNWNMNALKVRVLGPGTDRVVFDQSGNPLNRFTGDRGRFMVTW
ncbi:MAG: hypothetical protein H6555_09790 [Lewinellaceae bacterium]|nr:hypothetical protein [Lewinellaceae bacterium]